MQFIDLKAQYAALKDEIDANMQEVLNDAAFIGGKYVRELETQLAVMRLTSELWTELAAKMVTVCPIAMRYLAK